MSGEWRLRVLLCFETLRLHLEHFVNLQALCSTNITSRNIVKGRISKRENIDGYLFPKKRTLRNNMTTKFKHLKVLKGVCT